MLDTLNTNGLTLTGIIGTNDVLVRNISQGGFPTTPQGPATLFLTTSQPLPTTPLTAAQKNAILVPIVDPNLEQLATPLEIWFVVNAGVAVQWTRTFSTYVGYDGQLGRARYDSNGVSGGLQFSF